MNTAAISWLDLSWRKNVLPWVIVLIGLGAMFVPTFIDLFRTVWNSDEQAHGPIVLGLTLWLMYRKRAIFFEDAPPPTQPILAWTVLVIGGLAYAFGRSQNLNVIELGSLIWILAGLIILLRGVGTLKRLWFPLFFMLFMIPLPPNVVDAVTHPMKMAVSYVAEYVLYSVGYPIARMGVILQIGQYQLLVADACAGLHTLFTLEALGLLYLNVVQYSSAFRNVALALFIVPISFSANVIRVMVLTLVTYHFGDEAGQGFLHGFAGMVLFSVALLLIMGADSLLRLLDSVRRKTPAADAR